MALSGGGMMGIVVLITSVMHVSDGKGVRMGHGGTGL